MERRTSFHLTSWEEIESNMTFYLESKNQDSRSEHGNEKMEGHMTLHLDKTPLLSESCSYRGIYL
jgi:hypothetical protein